VPKGCVAARRPRPTGSTRRAWPPTTPSTSNDLCCCCPSKLLQSNEQVRPATGTAAFRHVLVDEYQDTNRHPSTT